MALKQRRRLSYSKMDAIKDKPIVLLVTGLIVGALVALAVSGGVPASSQKISGNVVALYEVYNPGVPLEVLDIQKDQGLYAVALQSGELQFVTYVTPDGKYVVQNPMAITGLAEAKEVRDVFITCLADSGALFYGSLSSNATIQQIQLLGGPELLETIYVSCDGDAAQSCINEGIESVPTWVIGEQALQGVILPEQLVQATGCEL
jgi:hypothetical protein